MATNKQFRSRNRARSEARYEGSAIIDDVLAMAGSLAKSRKEYAAAQLESLAESVRHFTETMPPIATMKAYATTAADSLDELATYVTDSDLTEMMSDAREFTRRHPLATLGGSIAAGLLITQLVQARSASQAPNETTRGRRRAKAKG